MLHRITKIISTKPYVVVCEWNNGEIRAINLEQKLKEWAAPTPSMFKALLDQKTFLSVKVDHESKTLYWPGMATMRDTSGKLFKTGLDLDPEVLYELSETVTTNILINNNA